MRRGAVGASLLALLLLLMAGRAVAVTAPNDPLFGLEWGFPQAGATQAWDLTRGHRSVIVGVVDTGIDATHPDLAPNLWRNPGEVPGNGRDDDGDGKIDDVRGWDFCGAGATSTTCGTPDADPSPRSGHGTAMASLIGGRGDDAHGVAGWAWNVQLLDANVFPAVGSASDALPLAGAAYAAERGARVVNLSFATTAASGPGWTSLFAAHPRTLFVAAAGNSSQNHDSVPLFPCTARPPTANLLCVGASDQSDRRWSGLLGAGSGYGAHTVDLFAPGKEIAAANWVAGRTDQFTSGTGTSGAAAMVSGAAALLLGTYPGLSGAGARSAILAGVDHPPALAGLSISGGRLNAYRSLVQADTTAPAGLALAAPRPGAYVRSRRPRLRWRPATDPQTGVTGYTVRLDGRQLAAPGPGTLSVRPSARLRQGRHRVRIWAANRRGLRSTVAGSFVVDSVRPRLRVRGLGASARRAILRIAVSETVRVRFTLVLRGRRYGPFGSRRLHRGRHRIALRLPRRVPAGARIALRVRAVDRAGNATRATAHVRVKRKLHTSPSRTS